MGLCLSKVQSGAGRGSVGSALDHVPPDSSVTTSPAPAEKITKGKNHVAPHPASPSALRQESPKAEAVRPPALEGASDNSRSLNGAPPSPGNAASPPGHMKRSQSLGVRNSSKQLPADSKGSPFAAAATAAATTTATASNANPEAPQPESGTTHEKESPSTPRRHASLRPGLQHRGSERNPNQSQIGGSKQMRRPKKPVTVSLEVLFQDERARLGFFRYLQATALQEKLREVEESETDNETDEMHMRKRRMSKMTSSRYTSDYREDCVLFWLEMSDLLKIPSGGSFQLGLMQDLFDVYIAKGALRQLPMVSAAEREPLHQFLQDKDVERALLAYKIVLLDVLEVVTTHFDEFVRSEGKLSYSQATKSVSMRNVLARLAKVNVGNTGDRRSHLNEIVNTPALCRIFREFLQDCNSVETLLFIIDALAFEDLVNTFDQEPELRVAHDGSHHDYCLRQAQKIFNKYIRYGSKAEICLGGAVKEKLLQEIVEYPLGAELFNDTVLVCSAELVHSHLDQFYGTSAYLAYKAARSQARSMKSSRKTRGTILKRHLSDEADGNPRGSAINSDKVIKTVELGDDNENSSDHQGYAGSRPLLSLTDILNEGRSSYLRDFLKEEGMENMLFFYKEVAEFQLLPHGQKHYIQSKARKIFDKFVRRGGKLEIELPADVRRDILWKLSAPTEHTFTDAQKYVFSYWEHNYLDKFRHHKLHSDMMNALQKLPNYGLPGSGTESKTKSIHVGSNGSSGDWVDVTKITLREFLDLEFLRRFFRLFLEKEQCANELYFYFEILNFQQFPTSDYLSRQAKKLFNRFCDPVSREFVSLKAENHAEIRSNLNNPSPAMFNKAQEEIVSFFTTTLFPKFQQSEIYRTIRITNMELRLGKLAASGNSASAEISQVRGRNGTMGDVSYAHRPSTSPSRIRNSVTPGTFAGVELSEDQVTMALILERPETRALFLFFSEEIFCTESIYFWLDCNEFKDIPHKSYLKLRAQKIYRKYISGNAKLQVNLESAIIKEIIAHIDDPNRTLFIPAQRSITKMLERDTLPKFRHSKHVRWLQICATSDAWKRLLSIPHTDRHIKKSWRAFKAELTFENQEQRASTTGKQAAMVSTAAATRTPGAMAADGSVAAASMDAQENRAPVHATRNVHGPVDALKETSKHGEAPTSPQHLSTPKDKQQQITPRRALQVIDANLMTPVTSRSAASPGPAGLHQQLKPSGGVVGKAPLSGLKRKHRSGEEIRQQHHQRTSKQQQHQLLSPPLGSAFDHDYESENLAWLDMLVALLERKYGKYSIPVSIKELEDAKQFEPLKKKQQLASSALLSNSGRESTAVEANGSSSSKSSSRRISGQHVAGKDHSGAIEEPSRGDQERQDKEKEERRQRVLLRHAQQIQNTSVSSGTCCGCKTGCLKMYCVCFSTRGFCHSSCACEDCKNSRQNKEQRVEAIQNYLANDPRAFSFASHQQNTKATGFLHLLPQVYEKIQFCGAARLSLQEVQVPEEILRMLSERDCVHCALPVCGLLERSKIGAPSPQREASGGAEKRESVPRDSSYCHEEAQAQLCPEKRSTGVVKKDTLARAGAGADDDQLPVNPS